MACGDCRVVELEPCVSRRKERADRRYYEALKNGDIDLWRNTKLEEVEDRGHHELLNWFCLVGAMHELGRTKPDYSTFLESWITNSDKVFAVYRPR